LEGKSESSLFTLAELVASSRIHRTYMKRPSCNGYIRSELYPSQG
jgi:hypothetical protein